jgi:hypothetical protein
MKPLLGMVKSIDSAGREIRVIYSTDAGEVRDTLTAPKRCGNCDACEIEKIGCACDGGVDPEGCFFCEPDTYIRPPCPKE